MKIEHVTTPLQLMNLLKMNWRETQKELENMSLLKTEVTASQRALELLEEERNSLLTKNLEF